MEMHQEVMLLKSLHAPSVHDAIFSTHVCVCVCACAVHTTVFIVQGMQGAALSALRCAALHCTAFPPCCVSSDGSHQRRASLPLSAYCAQALLDPLFADCILLDIPAEDKIFFGVVAYGRA
jgi:hypothetical protein